MNIVNAANNQGCSSVDIHIRVVESFFLSSLLNSLAHFLLTSLLSHPIPRFLPTPLLIGGSVRGWLHSGDLSLSDVG